MCPICRVSQNIVKNGFYRGKRTKIQRFVCRRCRRHFSAQTLALSYREKKPEADLPVLRLLESGVSQRRCAEILGLHRKTVARKLVRIGRQARYGLREQIAQRVGPTVVFDEMETFEHSKMKPLSIALAVEEKTRKIIAVEVASMPAKGLLAAKARKKYGRRRDDRPQALSAMCREIQRANADVMLVKSDQAPRYPALIAKHLPRAKHQTFLSRRACIVGQGELKAGGRDPLFSLNHTAAMVRDNIKTLSRKTWCTTKRSDRLQYLLYIYAWCHNHRLAGVPLRNMPLPPYALK
jgi:transposase-like protein